jgi:hypothetical protein
MMTAYQWNHTLIGWALVVLLALMVFCSWKLYRWVTRGESEKTKTEVHQHLHLHSDDHRRYLAAMESRRSYQLGNYPKQIKENNWR